MRTKGQEQNSSQMSTGRMEVPVAKMQKGVSRIGEHSLWFEVLDKLTRLQFLRGWRLGKDSREEYTRARRWLRGAEGA